MISINTALNMFKGNCDKSLSDSDLSKSLNIGTVETVRIINELLGRGYIEPFQNSGDSAESYSTYFITRKGLDAIGSKRFFGRYWPSFISISAGLVAMVQIVSFVFVLFPSCEPRKPASNVNANVEIKNLHDIKSPTNQP